MALDRRRWIVLLAVVAMATSAAALTYRVAHLGRVPAVAASPELQAVLWPQPHPLPEFRMTRHDGTGFGREHLRGQWNFIFFGYLQCPDVCPTTLQAMADFRRRLRAADPEAAGHRFVFVTVDPAHDEAAAIAGYLAHFDSDFTGLVGEPGQLARLARALGVGYAENVDARGVRSMDHGTSVLVVDPAGRVIGVLPAPHDPARMQRLFDQMVRHAGS